MAFPEGMGQIDLPEELVQAVKERQEKNRAETPYPEDIPGFYKDFLDSLTEEQRRELIRTQAKVMEKVGYEGDTMKYFIDDFKPDQFAKPLTIDSSTVLRVAKPRLVGGGALIGLAVAAMAFMAGGLIQSWWLVAVAVICIFAGVWFVMNPLGEGVES